MNIAIRRKKPEDFRTVEEVTREAFWNLYFPGCDEHYLVHMLRDHSDFIPELDFVAELDGRVIGNIMYTRSFVLDDEDNRLDTLTFGPVCVLPEFQHRGVGFALIGKTMELAKSMGEKGIIILGHPYNYCRHGFTNSRDFNISNSEGRFPFGQLACELEKGVFDGRRRRFFCSQVYHLDPADVENFDRQFPEKEKKTGPSQVEFSIAVRAYLD